MSKICPNCGRKNKDVAKFCESCGTKLDSVINTSNANEKAKSTSGLKGFWNKQSSRGKGITSVAACCLGVFLLVIIAGLLSPGLTALSVESNNISIDNVTTNLTINGTSEPNATINITAADLNINNATVKAGPDGKFNYTLKIPVNVTDTKVTVSAQNKDKFYRSEEITIQRPITPLTINQIPEIDNNTKNVTIEGDTDPQAVITVNSNELNVTNLVIHPDSKGHYKQVIQVPLNTTRASISVTAKSVGKRASNVLTANVTRITPQPAPQPPAQPAPAQPAPATTTQNTGSSPSGEGSYSPSSPESGLSSSDSGTYIGNARSHIFHYASCYHVDAMKDSNKVYFSSATAAENAGYRPCKDCNP
ncbi:Ada metal-binding domain-containing protein [Methanobacterium sp.]|uniref:Ada metal-binding domain-containing protein n=1 Tax=Methanobacterium sp. TaxID=2164 RepID=UPI003C71B38D